LGTYGRCVRCGSVIESQRLAQAAEAPLCLDCQSEYEGETVPATM
jgi:RNA polymerase-binding transcription factor DksA